MIALLLVLAQAGQKVWEFQTGNYINSTPAVVGGRVYIGSYDQKVYCLDAVTGAKQWEFACGQVPCAAPVVAGGRLYFSVTQTNKVYALDAADGRTAWEVDLGDVAASSPAVAGGLVYVSTQGGKLKALDAQSGEELWEAEIGAGASAPVRVSGGRVFAPGGNANRIHCLRATDGGEIWTFDVGGAAHSTPTVSAGRVYFGALDNQMYCVDAETGRRVWSFAAGGQVYSTPAVVGGRVFFGDFANNVYALDAATGEKAWQTAADGNVYASPAVVGGKVYVGNYNFKLLALDAADGRKAWEFALGQYVVGSAAVVGGRVYVGSWDQKLYCIDAGDPAADGWPMFGGRGFDWPTAAGATWTYDDGSTLTLREFCWLDGTSCAVFEGSDGVVETLSMDADGVHVRRREPAEPVTEETRNRVADAVAALVGADFKARDASADTLASLWYAARDEIETALRAEPETQGWRREIRRRAIERHAPMSVPFPLAAGKTWNGGEVLAQEAVSTGLGELPAWKLKIGDRTIWWSDDLGIPLAVETPKGRRTVQSQKTGN